MKSLAEQLSRLPEDKRMEILATLTDDQAAALAYDWRGFLARPDQVAPDGDWDIWLCLAGRGWGKALAVDTPIPTPSGWSVIGELQVGDAVFGSDGRETKVTYVTPYQYGRKCYVVRFSDGAEVVADADHQWSVRSRADRRAGRGFRTVTTADMLDRLTVAGERNWQMPAANPLILPDVELPVAPWLLGFWLGDGTSAAGEVTIGDADAEELLKLCEAHGAPVSGLPRRVPGSGCQTYPIGGRPHERGVNGRMRANGSLHSKLKVLGVLGNKHIPASYLRASKGQREALLSGLIDADGYVEHSTGRIEITVTRLVLAEGIAELARTLGHRARMSDEPAKINGVEVSRRYRVRFIARNGGGYLGRKKLKSRDNLGQPNRLVARYVDSIEPVPSVPVRCITVDAPDSLYLAGRDFLVTHNTRTGVEWVREQVKLGARRIALVAETQKDLEEVIINGDSGILAICPDDERPEVRYKPVRLTFPNGAIALGYNATEPNQLRGPQFDAALCDELAKWRLARETWDMLQFGLRLGDHPRVCITTTPRPIELLKAIVAGQEGRVVISRGATRDNRANLAKRFIERIEERYSGTRLGRQELNAEILGDLPGAIWTQATLDTYRVSEAPEIGRTVVAVDPAVTNTDDSDEHGIIVAGIGNEQQGFVLEDASAKGSPADWAKEAVRLYHKYSADGIVVEVNQGGDMVAHTIRAVSPNANIIEVRATKGKHVRAEPIAALYEQGRVRHVGQFPDLENQMTQFTTEGYQGDKSPDRVDALVWAMTELFPDMVDSIPDASRLQLQPSGGRGWLGA